ncbi:MAG: DNA-directed RNA polymerase subunit alpha C-terminal domain-containing protein [Gemmataceae bacterium]
MVDMTLIDLRAYLVERDDCDAGTVTKIRQGLAQDASQYRTLKEVKQLLEKKVEGATGDAAKRWHLKLGITCFFLGHLGEAANHLRQADGALAHFYLGRALLERQDLDGALEAFDKAEQAKFSVSQVQLQKAGIYRQQGDIEKARTILKKYEDQASHNAEYHFQLACCYLDEGAREKAIEHLEQAVEHDPGHTGALFQLGHANDLAGNDDEAIDYYEQCLTYPPVHTGLLMNLGILYEDNDKYADAVDCYRKLADANPHDEQARLFLKDAEASLTMYYNPDDEAATSRFSQVLEIPVTDFELSVRARNCLKKMNIRTLGDLTRVSEQQLLSSKNFGETSLQEIKDMLGSKALHLGQSLEDGGRSPGGYERRFASPQQPLSQEEQAVLGKPVAELNLSVRARKCMNRLGIATMGDLVQRTADELLESKNFGVTSLTEVREKLRQHGLTLRGD